MRVVCFKESVASFVVVSLSTARPLIVVVEETKEDFGFLRFAAAAAMAAISNNGEFDVTPALFVSNEDEFFLYVSVFSAVVGASVSRPCNSTDGESN